MTESYFMLGHSLGSYLVRRKLGWGERPPQHWQQDCPLSTTSCSQVRQKMSFGCFQCSEISVSGTCPTSVSDINTWKQDPTKYAKAVTYEGTPRCSVIRAGKRKENESCILRPLTIFVQISTLNFQTLEESITRRLWTRARVTTRPTWTGSGWTSPGSSRTPTPGSPAAPPTAATGAGTRPSATRPSGSPSPRPPRTPFTTDT